MFAAFQLVTWTMEESGAKFKSILKRMGGDVFVDLSVIGEIEHLKIFVQYCTGALEGYFIL